MTPRCISRVAVASLTIAAFALPAAAQTQNAADPYYGAAPPPPSSVAPYPAPAPAPPPPPQPYPPPVAGPPGPDYPYFLGGQRYCWYDDAWNGAGWYWCGYAWQRGYGWGGPYGWNRWVWHGWRGWRGWGYGPPRGGGRGREHFR